MRLSVTWPTTLGQALTDIERARAAGTVPLFADPRAGDAFRTEVEAAGALDLPPDTHWACTTSGTSGALRIVGRSASSWSLSFPLLDAFLGLTPGARLLSTTPPHSSMTVFTIAWALERGHTIVDDGPAELFHGAPHHLLALLESGGPLPPVGLVGGAAMDPALRARAEVAGMRVFSYYGATELSLVAIDAGAGLRPFCAVDIEIREGKVWVQSPFIASGYVVGTGPFETEGYWASVGDLGRMQQGTLRLSGRGDDALLSASATVIPAELEAQLRAVDGVRDAAVVGVNHDRLGVLVGALVEPEAHVDLDVTRVRDALRPHVSPSHLPRVWRIGTVPRNASGKVVLAAVTASFAKDADD